MGIRIPQDLSVVGFDGLFLNDVLEVPLTSIAQPWKEMSRDSIIHLINLINGTTHEQEHRIYKPKLVIRSSTYPLG